MNSENKMKRHKISRFISFCDNKVLVHNCFYQMFMMETTEFQVDSCVLVEATNAKKLGLHFGKELATEREFSNFVDCYAVAIKKDSIDYVPSGFENSFRSDPACYVAKYFKYKHCTKNFTRNAKSHETN